MGKVVFEWVADMISLNVLPSLLNSLEKDGFSIWQVTELHNTPATFLVLARKLK